MFPQRINIYATVVAEICQMKLCGKYVIKASFILEWNAELQKRCTGKLQISNLVKVSRFAFCSVGSQNLQTNAYGMQYGARCYLL